MTRRWKDQRSLVETVRLFLIDEVRVLHFIRIQKLFFIPFNEIPIQTNRLN